MKRHLLTTYPMPGSGLRRGKCSCGWRSSMNVDDATVKAEFAEHLKTEAAQQIDDLPRPDWAIASTTSWVAVGAQLRTRDGRVTGNAVVVDYPVLRHDLVLAEVVTDAGTQFFFTKRELEEFFYQPEWVMAVETAPGIVLRKLREEREESK